MATGNKPRTKENRNPFAQSTFAAQLTEATISGDRRVESANRLGINALIGVVVILVSVGVLIALVGGAI